MSRFAASPRLLVHGSGDDSTFAVRRRIGEGQAQWDRPVEGDEVYGMSSKGDVLTQLQSYGQGLFLRNPVPNMHCLSKRKEALVSEEDQVEPNGQ